MASRQVVPKELADTVLFGNRRGELPCREQLRQYAMRVRKMLKRAPFKVRLRNMWNVGYYLAPEDRARLSSVLDEMAERPDGIPVSHYYRSKRRQRLTGRALVEFHRQVVVLSSKPVPLPSPVKFSPTERNIAKLLVDHRLVSLRFLNASLYRDVLDCDRPKTTKGIPTMLHRVRRKIARHGIEVKNTWNVGWSLSADDRRRLGELIGEEVR